jgi:hypothetical protein
MIQERQIIAGRFKLTPASSIKINREKLVVIKHGEYVFKRNPYSPYSFDVKRITKPEDILKWVYHLTEKGWIDREAINQFVKLASEKIGFNIYGVK